MSNRPPRRTRESRINPNDPSLLRKDGRYKSTVYNSTSFRDENFGDFLRDYFHGLTQDQLGEQYLLPPKAVYNWLMSWRKKVDFSAQLDAITRGEPPHVKGLASFRLIREYENAKGSIRRAVDHCRQEGGSPERVAEYYGIPLQYLHEQLVKEEDRITSRNLPPVTQPEAIRKKNKGGRPKGTTRYPLDDLRRQLTKPPSSGEAFWSTESVRMMVNEHECAHANGKPSTTAQTIRNNLKALGVKTYKDFRNDKGYFFRELDYGSLVKRARNKASIFFLVSNRLTGSSSSKLAAISILASGKETYFRIVPLENGKINAEETLAPLLKPRDSCNSWAWEHTRIILVVPSKVRGELVELDDVKALQAKHPERIEVVELSRFDDATMFAIEMGILNEYGEVIPRKIRVKSAAELEKEERDLNMAGLTNTSEATMPLRKKKPF